MRVLHFIKSFSTVSETFIYDRIVELEQQGVDNHVVTFNRRNEEVRPFPKVHVVERPGRWNPRRLWYRALVPFGIGHALKTEWPQIRERLEKKVRRIEPDSIHAHFGPAAVFVAPVARRYGVPLIVSLYGYDISALPKNPFWMECYQNQLWDRANVVTVLSEEMRASAEEIGCPPEQLEVVHLSRDLGNFPFRPPDGPVRSILFVGRLVPKKAPLDAVRVVEEANRTEPGLSLEIVGDGPCRKKVEEYVEEHSLQDTVAIHGHLPNEAVSEKMQAADAFLLPSKTAPGGDREGTPTVLIEAQATGLPCITTQHAGIPEMIPQENHTFLAPEGNIEDLKKAIVCLAEQGVNELSCIAARGREKVERDFNLQVGAEKLRKIYHNTTAQ